MFAQTHTCLGYILLGRWQGCRLFICLLIVTMALLPLYQIIFHLNKMKMPMAAEVRFLLFWLMSFYFFDTGKSLHIRNIIIYIEIYLCMQSMDNEQKKSILIATGQRPRQTKNISCRSSTESISAINCWIHKVAEVKSSGQMICVELIGYMS